MGQVLKISCGCGYEKQMNIGEGMMAVDPRQIIRIFAEFDLTGFKQAVAERKKYMMGLRFGYCAACSDLFGIAQLSYELDDKTHTLQKPCPQCGGEVTLRESAGACPKCSQILKEQKIGMWD